MPGVTYAGTECNVKDGHFRFNSFLPPSIPPSLVPSLRSFFLPLLLSHLFLLY